MEHELPHTLALLERTPAALDALLRNLPDFWTRGTEGEGTWSAFDILGHLVHCERVDWMARARVILQFGDTQPFTPLDRQAQVHESAGKTLEQLLEEFALLRAQNLADLRDLHLQPADLARYGWHPALGAVTLSQLLAAWAAHDLTHLHQLARVMAGQYREAVGPWSQFLGVLHCNGHGAPA